MIAHEKSEWDNLESYDLYDVKIKDLNTHFEIRVYDEKMMKSFRKKQKIKSVDEVTGEAVLVKAKPRGSSEEFRIDNIARSYTMLRDYCVSNQALIKSFITLTFAENETDLTVCNRRFNVWCSHMARAYKSEKKKNSDGFTDQGFIFIGVPEFQERGAVHYHLMTNIPPNSRLLPRMARKALWKPQLGDYIDLDYYDLPFWGLGFSSAFTFEHVDENFSLVGYLGKYFFKNIVELGRKGKGDVDLRLFNRIKMLHSRNLFKPVEDYLDKDDDDHASKLERLKMFGAIEVRRIKCNPRSKYVPGVEIIEFIKRKDIDNNLLL